MAQWRHGATYQLLDKGGKAIVSIGDVVEMRCDLPAIVQGSKGYRQQWGCSGDAVRLTFCCTGVKTPLSAGDMKWAGSTTYELLGKDEKAGVSSGSAVEMQ